MVRISDLDSLKAGDCIRVEGNSYYRSMNLSTVIGVVKRVSLAKNRITINCGITNTVQDIEFGDGSLFVLNHDSFYDN